MPKVVAERVPAAYERRQTLANMERYATPELKTQKATALDADDRMAERERTLVEALRTSLTGQRQLYQAAVRLAVLDVLATSAYVAAQARQGYVRPELEAGFRLKICDELYPAVEVIIPADLCILNGMVLDEDARSVIVTGQNVAGRPTLLRLAGLSQILAQVTSFVPADSTRLGLVDQIFTGVGASDNLCGGRARPQWRRASGRRSSTNSPVLMDEVGGGPRPGTA